MVWRWWVEYRVHGTAKMLAAGLVLKSFTSCRISSTMNMGKSSSVDPFVTRYRKFFFI